MLFSSFLGLILPLLSLTNGIQSNIANQLDSYPEQIHLSYGSTPDQMIVTWVTLDYVNESTVEYGINNFKNAVTGVSEVFTDGGSEKRKINIHRVILSDLKPDQTYSKH